MAVGRGRGSAAASYRHGVVALLCSARGPRWHSTHTVAVAHSACECTVATATSSVATCAARSRPPSHGRLVPLGVLPFAADGCTHARPHLRTRARTQCTHGHTDTHTVAHARARAYRPFCCAGCRARVLSAARLPAVPRLQRPLPRLRGPPPPHLRICTREHSDRAPVGTARLYRKPSRSLTAVKCRSTPDFTVQCRNVRALPTVASGTSPRSAVANRRGVSSALCGRAARHARPSGRVAPRRGGGTASCHGRLPMVPKTRLTGRLGGTPRLTRQAPGRRCRGRNDTAIRPAQSGRRSNAQVRSGMLHGQNLRP